MKTVAFFDAKPYDREWFDKFNTQYEIRYLESKLTPATVQLAAGSDAVCAFVNDTVNAEVIDKLDELGMLGFRTFPLIVQGGRGYTFPTIHEVK